MIASRPIITSNDEGPILGSLIMGYYYDSTRLDNLAEITHLSLDMQRFNNSEMPSYFQEALPSLSEGTATSITPIISVVPIDSNSIAGYTLFEDIYGEPALVLRIDVPRSIYQQGQTSVSYFFLWSLTAGIIFIIVIMLLLEKTVITASST